MTKFKIGDTVTTTETRKIVSVVEHDKHPYRLDDGNWYSEDQLSLLDDKPFDFAKEFLKLNYGKKLEENE